MYTPTAGQKLGHFRVLEQIGAGGMGVVFRAHDEQLDRDVAIKVLAVGLFSSDATRRHFRKEALTISRLNHPNIATVHEFGTQDGVDFLVMEYIPGQTLSDRLASGSIPEKEILQLGIQLADGLKTAHHERILHRDLKPGNLRITPEGRLKILDFGLARLLPASVESLTTESAAGSGNIPGTLPYMAPEQLREEPADERADIYSAGAVLYEMATGRRPFPHTHVPRLVEAILHDDPDPPSMVNRRISAELETIILKSLDKAPERRYQSVNELHVDLQRLALPTTYGSTVPARSKYRLRRNKLVLPLIVVFALLIVLGWFLLKPAGDWLPGDLPAQKHVAVLPFTNIGDDPEKQVFCDGLIETITSQLTQLQQYHGALWIVPASEVRAENVNSVREAQKLFGVTLVVTGSVQRDADRVQLTANLVDAKSLRQLHAITIRTDIHDPVLQDGLVNQIAGMMNLQLAPESQKLLASGRTPVGRAYDLYLQGQGYLQRPDRLENLESAILVFVNALELDPEFALAYAGLARAFWHRYDMTGDHQWVEPARLNAKRAVEHNGELPAVRVTLGIIQIGTGEYEQAIVQFQQALKTDPVNFDAFRGLAQAYEKLGEPQKAEASYQRAIDLKPANPFAYTSLGSFYYSVERYDGAVKMFEQVVRLVPDNHIGYSNLGAIYLVTGDYTEAVKALEKSIAIRPNSDGYWNLGYAYFLMRRFGDAAACYEQAAKLKQPEHYFVWGGLGDSYYWSSGRHEKANAAYERAITVAQRDLTLNPRDANALIGLSYFYGKLGNKDESLRYLEEAMDLKPDNAHFAFLAALVYSHLGERSVALDWLERAAAGGYSKAEIRDRIEFEDLHADGRFQALVQEVPKSKE